MIDPRALVGLLQGFARPERRSEAADALARALGVQRVLLYVRDPALDVLLPAPGLPQTVAGGRAWREFLRQCRVQARPCARIPWEGLGEVTVTAVCLAEAAVVLVGDGPVAAELLDALEGGLPLLAALLHAQHALKIERAEANVARESAARARELASALDTARAAASELNLQLRQEHERKDEFLAMLAHELRNPLSPLVNSIEILRRTTTAVEPRTSRQLEMMARQLQQLTRLVDDLLDVSRVSRGMVELRRERVPLHEILDDAIEIARPLLESRAHTLQRTAVPPDMLVHGDRVRLTQVFANLLTNAAKYTEPRGRVTLSAIVDGNRISVVVQDNGIGIPQGLLPRIFDLFTQGPSGGRSGGGLGIGLTLARRLVEMHGGHISAYSRGEGQGSTFTVSLPQVLLRAPLPAARRPAAGASPADGQLAPGLRVLVVDDNRDAAQSLATLIECFGAETRVALDGEQGVELAAAFSPQLVIMDIALPGLDGFQALEKLRKLPDFRARVVAMTGYGTDDDRQRSLRAGFDDHLVKPVPPEKVEKLLSSARGGSLAVPASS